MNVSEPIQVDDITDQYMDRVDNQNISLTGMDRSRESTIRAVNSGTA